MSNSFDDSIAYVEDALFCVGPSSLSYCDPDQKWIIRQHLVSLCQDFPSFKPSAATFTHDDGSEFRLLRATGELNTDPPVPLIIWVHELYPHTPPMVYVDSRNTLLPIYDSHPFVDSSSGATTSPYLHTWLVSGYNYNLSDLVRNLARLFSYNHPIYYTASSSSSSSSSGYHPSMVSKMEAMDRLTSMIFYDMKAIVAKNEGEIRHLSAIGVELRERGDFLKDGILELELEEEGLKATAEELVDECDKISNWSKVYDMNYVWRGEAEDVFECWDKKSEILMELSGADNAIQDLMYALDKAVEEGVVGFEVYMKQIRILGREQFFHRAKIERIQRS